MLDADFVRKNPDIVRKAIIEKHEKADVDAFLALDATRREILGQAEALRTRRNENSKKVGELKRSGGDATALMDETRKITDEVNAIETQLAELDKTFRDMLLRFPNIPAKDTPPGEGAPDNVEVRHWGERAKFSFKPLPHWDIAKNLDIIDFERATKISQSFFVVYKGAGARLERALYNFMLDMHTAEHGYTEILAPYLVNRKAMTGTGQLPKLEEDMYHATVDDLFLIPTAEVPVTNLHMDETFDGAKLPIYYTAYSACFRREAGSYGRDTKGLMRVHQFDKVEMVKFVRPGTSYDELESLVRNAEDVLQRLGVEYRVMNLCAGELSFAAAKCYDIEIWSPGIERWLEVSSCSNFEDFQARRANIKFRDKGEKPQFVHTLNGSGVALARLVAVLLEQYQTEDGHVRIPEPLRPYMKGAEVI